MDDILQLKITLQDTKPPIWRRVLVEKSRTFYELHYIIQIAMGWQNSHLFEFEVGDTRISLPEMEMEGKDAKKVKLGKLLTEPKQKFDYMYDFGDGWQHQVEVEKILPQEPGVVYPVCTDGKLNCPPEDCGGVWGFYEMLEAVKDPKHPEHKELLEWLGDDYDPKEFSTEERNQDLANLKKYIRATSFF